MAFAGSKFIGSMVDTIVLFIAQIYKAIIATPSVRMNHAIRINPSTE